MVSVKAQPAEEPSNLDVIFACSVCGDTLSDVYEGYAESVQGLSDGINNKERLVTRLFISSCCHVICIKHIEDGNGPSFHPTGEQPRAPCPVCEQETGEKRARELYSVRGFKPGEHDPAIPKFWFSAPPMKLDANGKEMEALRFQYLALTRFGRQTSAALKRTKAELEKVRKERENMADVATVEHAKGLSLEEEISRLLPLEQELYRLKARGPAIQHYLGLMPKLIQERELLKEQLSNLGYQLALEPMPYYPEPLPLNETDHINDTHADARQQKTCSSHTAGRSRHNTGYAEEVQDSSSPQTRRPHKRARVDTPPRSKNIHAAPSSRDMMPPPTKPISKPMSRMKSVRNFIPTSVRQRFSSKGKGKSSSAQQAVQLPGSDVQMYENGYCEPVDPPSQPSSDRARPPTRHGGEQGLYMSGALPIENSQQVTSACPAHSLPSVGLKSGGAEFTFRSASPIKLQEHHSDTLPTQPSYIRLMDGLDNDPTLNLGLQDPRSRTSDQTYRNTQISQRGEENHGEGQARKHRASEHAYDNRPLHRDIAQSHGYRHPDSLRSHLPDASMGNAHDGSAINPVTPGPSRFRPTQEVDNVVSPFFGSSNRNPPQFSRTSVAERQHSTIRSNNYPSHRQREPEPESVQTPRTVWQGGHSLNGLSFFNSPLNKRNEPIEWRHEGRPSEYIAKSQQPFVSRNVNSRGFIRRPDDDRSPYVHDSSYGSLERPFCSRQPPVQPHSTIPFQPFSRASHSRAAPPSSAMPPIVRGSNRSPVHPSPLLMGLERAGVRSSGASYTQIPGNTIATPVMNLFTGSGRRSVRR